MNEVIIAGIFGVIGAFVGGGLSYLASRRQYKYDSIKKKTTKLAEQIKSYWNLENLYCEELAKITGKNSTTVKIEFRDKIVSQNLARPIMTETQANKILTEIENL